MQDSWASWLCCWWHLFWCQPAPVQEPPRGRVGRRHGQRSLLHRNLCRNLTCYQNTQFSDMSTPLWKDFFVKKTNLVILQQSVPLTSGMPPGDALGLTLLQGLPKPRLEPVECRAVYQKEIQFHQQRWCWPSGERGCPPEPGLLLGLLFCRSASFSPGLISSRLAAPVAVRVKHCSINPGPSLGLMEIESDQSFPWEGRGRCVTWGTGQRVLEELVYKKKKRRKGCLFHRAYSK